MKRGFSLVELSIILIVISLLMVGITSLDSVLSNYRNKKLISDMGQYASAFKIFYDRHSKLPGDMDEGYTLFGDVNCTDNIINSSNKGCRGNNSSYSSSFGATIDDFESIVAWYHLYKDNFIEFNNLNNVNINNESGSEGPVGGCANDIVYNIGQNIPPLHIKAMGLFLYEINGVSNEVTFLVSKGLKCKIEELTKNFTVKEIKAIDIKYDDANSQTGLIRNFDSLACIDNLNNYNISTNGKICNLYYSFAIDTMPL